MALTVKGDMRPHSQLARPRGYGRASAQSVLLASTSGVALSLIFAASSANAACVPGATATATTLTCTGTVTQPTTVALTTPGSVAVTLGDSAPTFVTVSSGAFVNATLTGASGTFAALDTGPAAAPSSVTSSGDVVPVTTTNGASILIGQGVAPGSGTGGLNANLTSTGGNGINATAAGAGAVAITTAAGSTVTGALSGITASVVNGGANVTFNGNVTTTTPGSFFDVNVTSSGTGGITISGSGNATNGGIFATSSGTGGITIGGTGNTTDTLAAAGIVASITNTASAGGIQITRSGAILGATDGIRAGTSGTGNLLISTSGSVTGNSGYGIYASVTSGTATINVGSGSTVQGTSGALFAANTSGSTIINNSGNLIGGISTSGTTTINNSGSLLTSGTINANIINASGSTFAPATLSSSTAATGATGTAVAAAAAVTTANPANVTVNGSLTFQPGSVYGVVATPTAASSTTVTGLATLAGTVSVAANGNFAPTTQYQIISASRGVSGTFGSVITNMAFLTPSLSYDANNAYLTLTRNQTTIQSTATPNTMGVASAVSGPGGNSQLGQAFLGLSAAQAQAALNAISGEGNVSVQTIGQNATHAVTSFLSDRATPDESGGQGTVEVSSNAGLPAGALQYVASASKTSPIVVDRAPPPKKWRVFATGFGGASNLQGQDASGVAGQTGNYYGGLVGLDYRVSSDLLIGAAAGGNASNYQVAARGSSGSVTGFNGSVFSVASFGSFYGQSLTTLSSFSNDTTRNIAGFGGLASAVEKASFGSLEIRTRAEFGRVVDIKNEFGINKFKITPFVAMEIARLHTNGYNEYNAAGGSNVFNLTAQGTDYTDVRSFIGGRFEATYALANGMMIRPIVRLAYVHSFSGAPVSFNTFQSIPSSTFTIAGANIAHNAAETKAGAELDLGAGRVIFANFEGEFSSLQQVYGGRGGLRISF